MFGIRVLRVYSPMIAFAGWASVFIVNLYFGIVTFNGGVQLGGWILLASQVVGAILGVLLVPPSDGASTFVKRNGFPWRDVCRVLGECRRSGDVIVVLMGVDRLK